MVNPVLEVKNLTKSYDGETIALNNISLRFQPEEFVVVIGPSGSGKSTFIRSINRLVEPTSGQIIFDNKDITDISTKKLRVVRSQIGMIFQNYNLINRSNVLKNVLNGKLGQLNQFDTILGRFSQDDVQMAVDLLTEMGLEDHIYKRADALSGGQMQRVGICRAMMQSPKLLLADEPIASLDPASSKVVMDHLYQTSKTKGLTSIVNLHQVDIAKQYATRIVGIHKGELVFDGSPGELTDAIVEKIYGAKLNEATVGMS